MFSTVCWFVCAWYRIEHYIYLFVSESKFWLRVVLICFVCFRPMDLSDVTRIIILDSSVWTKDNQTAPASALRGLLLLLVHSITLLDMVNIFLYIIVLLRMKNTMYFVSYLHRLAGIQSILAARISLFVRYTCWYCIDLPPIQQHTKKKQEARSSWYNGGTTTAVVPDIAKGKTSLRSTPPNRSRPAARGFPSTCRFCPGFQSIHGCRERRGGGVRGCKNINYGVLCIDPIYISKNT